MAEPMGGTVAKSDNKRALWALIVGIVGLVCCGGLLGPVAWWMGRAEVKAVDAGLSPRENRGLALAGMILGIIGTIYLVFMLLWVFLFGGLAFFGAMTEMNRGM